MVGAVLAEQTEGGLLGLAVSPDEWAEGRRYLGLDVLARCRITIVPTTDTQIGDDHLPALTA